nr:transketolase [Pseudomonas sp. NBRC 111137]
MLPRQALLQKLAQHAWRIRRYALLMGEVQGEGYVGQALGWSDVLAVAYCHFMKLHPENPSWEGRDRFLLSHGHYAIALYAALLEAKVLDEDEIDTYGCDDSRLPISGMVAWTPGMEMSGGSLGQGLAIAVGQALALRLKDSSAWVINSMSDGELNEGSTWEAAMSASHYGLSNLINLIDLNKQQADGRTEDILHFEPLAEKWQAFGWHVQRIDGNDLAAVLDAFELARSAQVDKPRVILCDTVMGKGVPFLETREKNHFIRVDTDEWQRAITELDHSFARTRP